MHTAELPVHIFHAPYLEVAEDAIAFRASWDFNNAVQYAVHSLKHMHIIMNLVQERCLADKLLIESRLLQL